ncbi:uncharacterized protein JCM15063_004836 [Sporobolomyces koalae]|uniref:uncharacterized protein n=1 Tax=Sporobolomyces koalae TaxID=500713 RepID=UPI003181D245
MNTIDSTSQTKTATSSSATELIESAAPATTTTKNPLWIKALADSAIGIVVLVFLGSMSCCIWRIRQSNRAATLQQQEEHAMEEERVRTSIERKKRKSRDAEAEEYGSTSDDDQDEDVRRSDTDRRSQRRGLLQVGHTLSDTELDSNRYD